MYVNGGLIATGHGGARGQLFDGERLASSGNSFFAPQVWMPGACLKLSLAGTLRIGGAELTAGDHLFTSPGEEHDVVAVSDATIFVSSQKRTFVVE